MLDWNWVEDRGTVRAGHGPAGVRDNGNIEYPRETVIDDSADAAKTDFVDHPLRGIPDFRL